MGRVIHPSITGTRQGELPAAAGARAMAKVRS